MALHIKQTLVYQANKDLPRASREWLLKAAPNSGPPNAGDKAAKDFESYCFYTMIFKYFLFILEEPWKSKKSHSPDSFWRQNEINNLIFWFQT